MSNEEEKVSRAFLQSVLKAEAADAEEPEEMPDPEADRRLAQLLADKYSVPPKAATWFRRPAAVAGITALAAAAVAVLVLRMIEPPQTLPTFRPTVEPETSTLGSSAPETVIRPRKDPRWKVILRAAVPLTGDTTTRAFIRHGESLDAFDVSPQRVGNTITLIVDTQRFVHDPEVQAIDVVTCRVTAIPSDRRLRKAVLSAAAPVKAQSVPLSIGDCQLSRIPIDRSDIAPK